MAEEKQFEIKVKRYLESMGIYPAGYRIQDMAVQIRGWYAKIWGGGYQRAGIPDILICANGIFIAVELKAPYGRPSELQKLNVSRINKAGGIALFLKPAGFGLFQKIIEEVIGCNGPTHALTRLSDARFDTSCTMFVMSEPCQTQTQTTP